MTGVARYDHREEHLASAGIEIADLTFSSQHKIDA